VTLEQRARELRRMGRTSLRIFRVLRREYPNAEWFDLWVVSGEGPTGITPTWAMNGSSPAEARYRNDPRED
jgi:hypothetical protein